MLDIHLIREETQRVRDAMQSRGVTVDLDSILQRDIERRRILVEVEGLKKQRNEVSRKFGRIKAEGGDVEGMREDVRRIGERIAGLDAQLREVEKVLSELLLQVPNIPHASVPVGKDSSANQVVRSWGEMRDFPFDPLPHWKLGERLGLFDFPRAAKMSGTGFVLFRGPGARLERALINFMLDVHVREHGYEEVSPPFLTNAAAMTGTGQLPKMAEDMYRVVDEDLYLVPTAEVPLTNIYRDEVIAGELPIRLVAYTPCFRREAGAAGRETRGLIRVHQFDKVELVKFVEPEHSYEELESLVADAEDILRRLGLPYRVVELCTGDLSFAAAKCYDIELWSPGHKGWLEVSSCSNFEDFQARRARIRFRRGGHAQLVHTLNGSGVALARLVVAILENYQQADGSVVIPDVLRAYMDGMERIEPVI